MIGTLHPPTTEDAMIEFLTCYHELNSGHVDELQEAPTPLLFMQYIAKNRPFVLRGGATRWPAISLWSPEYLRSKMRNSSVKVAVTPFGSGSLVFYQMLQH